MLHLHRNRFRADATCPATRAYTLGAMADGKRNTITSLLGGSVLRGKRALLSQKRRQQIHDNCKVWMSARMSDVDDVRW